MNSAALHALRHFGFGRRGLEPIPDKPRDWLASQLEGSDPWLTGTGPSFHNVVHISRHNEALFRSGMNPDGGFAELFASEMVALLNHAARTDLAFRERLVWFWSNHFTVSQHAGGWPLGALGAYIHEAIRPHVTGRFVDLLKAVMRHPAMIYYLNNDESVGPHSVIGLRQHRGINENLARECLELHTLGVHAGYTQQDVTAFAVILTGRWVFRDGNPPGFVFRDDMHEPGRKRLMGREFPEGFAGSEAALEWLAGHPATHRHLARQLVRHFVADIPPPDCVVRVEDVLGETQGDLKQAMLTIIDLEEAWQPLTKFRAPAEYAIAVERALGLPPEPPPAVVGAPAVLGQPFMGPVLPNGWPDTASDWLSGEALLMRADWAMTQSARPGAPSAEAVASATLGELCSDTTYSAIRNCPTPAEALATLFASPEFVRR
jgi:uncharacterized protein (DUF1800 family)